MVTRSKPYKGMRAFVVVLDSLQTTSLYPTVSQRSQQFGLRPSLRQSTFATTSAAQRASTSSESAISSTGNPRHQSPDETPPLHPKPCQPANAFNKSTLWKAKPKRVVPITETRPSPADPPIATYPASFWDRVNESPQGSPTSLPPAESCNETQLLTNHQFLDDWFLHTIKVLKEGGWLFTWSFTPSDTESNGRYDCGLSHPGTADDWTVSVWGATEKQARRKAYSQLFARIHGTVVLNEHSGTWLSTSEAYLMCLKMILDGLLVLELECRKIFKKKVTTTKFQCRGRILVQGRARGIRFSDHILEYREVSAASPANVICKVVSALREEGIWKDLLKELEDIPQNMAREKELEMAREEELEDVKPLTQESFKTLLMAFIQARGQWSERFHDQMASVPIDTKIRIGMDGVRRCRAYYRTSSHNVKSVNLREPVKPVSRSQFESMAIQSLLPRLEDSGIWDRFLENRPSLFLSDDIIWQVQNTRDELSLGERTLERSFLANDVVRDFSRDTQHRTVQPEVRLEAMQERSKELTGLLRELERSRDPKIVAIRSARAELPVSGMQNELLEMINQHTYSIVSAETGSGKSTQIPQMVLDDAIRKGSGGECRVLCIQPRRVAAELLAARVALERNEVVGETVGYAVRFSHKPPVRHGSITYCTPGIFLNMFGDHRTKVESFTHIMLDEVHVRGMEIDFIMLLLKRHIEQCRSTGTREPHIVIMSATVDQDLFSSYFCNGGPDGTLHPAPSLSISGRQFHVKQHYLDDIFDDLTTSFNPSDLSSILNGEENELDSFLDKHYERFGDIEHSENSEGSESTTPNSIMERPAISPILEEDDTVPHTLITALVFHLLATTKSGSILIFLPGLFWIDKVHLHLLSCLRRFGTFGLAQNDQLRVMRLHSELHEELEKLAEPVPPGCRRILLSTDVAEASITLPDVSYVIDSGKLNQQIHDPATQSHRLACFWVSKANAVQRAGRAGRVQNGDYYFLGTERCYDSLQPAITPAIMRENLLAMCLRAKSVAPDVPILEILQQAIEPPSEDRVLNAVESLQRLKALGEDENITSLGVLLSQIGLNPQSAKLIILGLIFRCLDPLLVLAVQEENTGGSLFQSGKDTWDQDRINALNESKMRFAAGSRSDHIAEINAFNALRTKYDEGCAWDYAASNYLQSYVYMQTFQAAAWVLSTLHSPGLISWRQSRFFGPFGGPELNVNSNNIPLIKILIAHCFPGNVASPHPTYSKAFFTSTAGKSWLRGNSAAVIPPDQPRELVAYSSKRGFAMAPNTFSLVEGSVVSPFALCLLGERLTWDGEMLHIDSWLPLLLEVEHGCAEDHAKDLIEIHDLLHMHLDLAYSYLNAKRSRMPVNGSHRWSARNLPRLLMDLLSLDKVDRVSKTQLEWNIWEQMGEDCEEGSAHQNQILPRGDEELNQEDVI